MKQIHRTHIHFPFKIFNTTQQVIVWLKAFEDKWLKGETQCQLMNFWQKPRPSDENVYFYIVAQFYQKEF